MKRPFICITWILVACPVAMGLDFDGWQVTGPGRVVSSSAERICVAYESPRFSSIVARPPQPISLPEAVCCLRLWYARVEGDFDLYFVVRDATGREHAVRSRTSRPTFPGIRRYQMRDWSVWNQAESVNVSVPAPIEDRVQPEFLAIARNTVWTRPLALTGIEIRPASDRRDNEAYAYRDSIRAGKGKLCLAELAASTKDGLEADFNWFLAERWRWGWDVAPRLFLDDLTRISGEMRYAIKLRKGYQGPAVWRTTGAGTIDRADPMALFDQRIELPELPMGHYFITTKAWAPDGTLEYVRSMRLCVATGKAANVSPVETPMRWETGRPHHVFPPDTVEADLVLRIDPSAWPRTEERLICAVRIADWLGRPIYERVHEKNEVLQVACPGVKEGTDYTATAELRVGAKVVDREVLHFGVASKLRDITGATIPSLSPTRDELLMSRRAIPIAEHWGSLLSTRYELEPVTPERIREFDTWLEEAAGLGFKFISFNFGWGEVEPLPGVYRWAEIERRVELVGRRGLHVLLTPATWGHPLEYPRWLEFQPMRDQFGAIGGSQKSHLLEPSFWDTAHCEGNRGWLKAVAQRFLDNPTVVGYRTKPFIFNDENKPQFTRTDYSPPAQHAFAGWLKARRKKAFPLAKLFCLPPYSPARTGPDLSQAWQDFMNFRTHTYIESVRDITSAIRAVDARRQIHIYRSSTPNACEAAIPLLRDNAEFHDEGGPFYFQRAMESLCLQAGVPYTNEGHQFTPPSRAMVDSGFFYGSCYDRGWCWLYRWNIHRPEDKRFAALPEVLDYISRSQPALVEWVSARGKEPELLVFGSRADRLLGDGRQGFYAYISGIEVFTALFCYHQIPAHFANEYADWVNPDRFKVVFAVGDVLAQHSMDRLVDYASRGRKLVLVGDVGMWCPEHPKARHLLRKKLENMPNVMAINAPDREPPPPGAVSYGGKAFDRKKIDEVLAWAQIQRDVRTDHTGFDCLCRYGASANRVYVAVFRKWPGHYENVWYDEEVKKRWGLEGTGVVVSGMRDGPWRVEKFHRSAKNLGIVMAKEGSLRFEVERATVGELQLFRLTGL